MYSDNNLAQQAYETLAANDFETHTRPAERLYPHQWLWDSCFIAIGLRHKDPDRAMQEIASLFKGQWRNGMMPHMIFAEDVDYHAGPSAWGSADFDDAPQNVHTSCITQPPVLAEAMQKVGNVLPASKRLDFYTSFLPKLIDYHLWLYRVRDPHKTGKIALIHAWESGIENAPYWSAALERVEPPKVREARQSRRLSDLDAERPDLKHAPLAQRPSSAEYFSLYHTFDVVHQADYDLNKASDTTDVPLIYDGLFNAVFMRANACLGDMAEECGVEIPINLQECIKRSRQVYYDTLTTKSYHLFPNQDYRTGKFLDEHSISELMGIYAECTADNHQAAIQKLQSDDYWPKYGITSTPVSSPYYEELRFWRGPMWINTNWLLIEGLERIGQTELARKLTQTTLDILGKSKGMHEYYGAQSGEPAGAVDFSWTAALTIDLIENKKAAAWQ